MKAITINNVEVVFQIPGFGQKVVTFNLITNVSQLLDMNDYRKFILEVKIDAFEHLYSFSRIYGRENIDIQGNIVIGEINIIGELRPEEISIQARVIYLEGENNVITDYN